VRVRKDGFHFLANVIISTLCDKSGKLVGFVKVSRDVSERKHLEDRLRQAQKMEAIGRLSGGVAHDFNNLLGVIIGYSELVEERLNPDDPLRPKIEEIKKAGERGASLTRQLLAFSRQQVLEPKILNLNSVVADIQKMLQRLIGEDIELVMKCDPNLALVKADRGQIEQVIMNLAVNARDSMPNGGKLRIETTNIDLDEFYARQHPTLVPGAYVMLMVTDTGIGMEPETQTHIFEPFFTTKAPGKGTGLGLATVYGIVKQSGGYVWVYSELGRGTTF
jgi:signal transduction histidine kinase